MIELFRAAQIPLLACVLLAGGVAKLTFRDTLPHPLAAIHRQRPVAIVIALIEGALGTALLVTGYDLMRYASVVGFATATYVVAELARHRPEQGCGCFGSLSTTPVRYRAIVRAVLLTGAAGSTVGVHQSGFDVLTEPVAWLIVIGELGLLSLVSPEVQVVIARFRQRTPCELREIPLPETYRALRASDAWRTYARILDTAEPTDVWRELCHRFVLFSGDLDGRPVEVVFAVDHSERHPSVTPALLPRSQKPAVIMKMAPRLIRH
jgi:hypothetical protein